MHAQTDDECLGFARDIRVILTELAERLGQVLREQAQLDEAVGRLLEKDRNKKK